LQELLEFTDNQIQDVLYLRRIVAARAHDLEKQRHEATVRMLSQAAMKQHPSDHLAESKASSQELKLIGMEEYKLHGIATDALANGVSLSSLDVLAECDVLCGPWYMLIVHNAIKSALFDNNGMLPHPHKY
jgi:hypothetical protein